MQKIMKNKLNNRNSKNFIWNAIGSLANSFNSLFFLILVTRINGLNDAGIFSFAFAISGIFYIIGVYSGRTFQVTESKKGITDYNFIIHRIITCLLMMLVSIIFVLINKYEFYKSSIFLLICLFRCIEAFSDVIYGIIQKRDKLDKVGKSFLLKSIVGIVVFFLVDYIFANLIFSVISLCAVNLFFIFIYDYLQIKKLNLPKEHINKIQIKQIFQTGLSICLFTLISLYVVNASRYAIDQFMHEEDQAIFGIISLPSTIMIIFGQLITHPILTRLVDKYKKNDNKGFINIINLLNISILFVAMFALILAYFLGIPVLEFIYGISLTTQKMNLLIMICGATIYTISVVISNALITMGKTLIQLIIYFINAILAFIVANFLVQRTGLLGGTSAYLIVMTINLILYISVFLFLMNKSKGSIKNQKTNGSYISNFSLRLYILCQRIPFLRKMKIILYFLDSIVLIFIKKPKNKENVKKKVMIIYNYAFGDGIIFLCAAKYLRIIYPEEKYELSLICQEGLNLLYENEKIFDKIIPFSLTKATFNLKTRYLLYKLLRKQYYDIVLDPIGCPECTTNLFMCNALVAEHKISILDINSKDNMCPKWLRKKIYTQIINIKKDKLSLLEYYASFIRGIGLENFRVGLEKPKDIKNPIELPEKYFIVFPGASTKLKIWPIERYAEITKRIYEKTKMPLVFCGTKNDKETIEELKNLLKDIPYIDIQGKTNLLEFIQVIKQANLVITNDTSAYHIAVVEEVPVAIITGGYTYSRYVGYDFDKKGEFKKPCIITYKMDCFDCDNQCKKIRKKDKIWPCLEKITIEDAWIRIKDLIEREIKEE